MIPIRKDIQLEPEYIHISIQFLKRKIYTNPVFSIQVTFLVSCNVLESSALLNTNQNHMNEEQHV